MEVGWKEISHEWRVVYVRYGDPWRRPDYVAFTCLEDAEECYARSLDDEYIDVLGIVEVRETRERIR